LIDISIDRRNSRKAHVYLDGPDARLFRRLREKLDSDELAQSAIILAGFIRKLEDSENTKKKEEIVNIFPKVAGLSYAELQRIAASI
jgi:folate-dependent phosphoribosylglycinamide formyltransferase PurN